MKKQEEELQGGPACSRQKSNMLLGRLAGTAHVMYSLNAWVAACLLACQAVCSSLAGMHEYSPCVTCAPPFLLPRTREQAEGAFRLMFSKQRPFAAVHTQCLPLPEGEEVQAPLTLCDACRLQWTSHMRLSSMQQTLMPGAEQLRCDIYRVRSQDVVCAPRNVNTEQHLIKGQLYESPVADRTHGPSSVQQSALHA